jgi:disulfide bond formation protein DsbB
MSTRVDSDSLPDQSSSQSKSAVGLACVALLVALLGTFGSLWLSLGMGLKACPLCFYQRTFAMSVVGVLGIGLLIGARHRNVLSVLALPPAVGGLGVAAFHVSLELTGKLECPAGLMGLGTAPQQSLAVFLLLTALIVLDLARVGGRSEPRWVVSLAAFVLGALFAAGAVASAPPMPPIPTEAYKAPLEICRPPYRPDS